MRYDRYSLPVRLLHQWKTNQYELSEATGLNRPYISNVLGGKLKWPARFTDAFSEALGSAEKAEIIRTAALEERHRWLIEELEVVTTEQASS